jgi:hypothetical protein
MFSKVRHATDDWLEVAFETSTSRFLWKRRLVLELEECIMASCPLVHKSKFAPLLAINQTTCQLVRPKHLAHIIYHPADSSFHEKWHR